MLSYYAKLSHTPMHRETVLKRECTHTINEHVLYACMLFSVLYSLKTLYARMRAMFRARAHLLKIGHAQLDLLTSDIKMSL